MGGGVDVKFLTFNGQQRATKIEKVQTREQFWLSGNNVTIAPSPMKECLP